MIAQRLRLGHVRTLWGQCPMRFLIAHLADANNETSLVNLNVGDAG